jgi:hypothetical protein
MKSRILITCLLFLTLYFNCQVTNSLQACYSLAGDVNDPINNLNGTAGSVTGDADRLGVVNECYSFGGSLASVITLPNDSRLKGQAMTISLWVYPTNVVTGQYIVFTKNPNFAYHEAYALSVGSSVFSAVKCNTSGNFYVNSTFAPSVNTWYHLAICVDGSNLSLFVNGVQQGSTLSAPGAINYDPAGKPVCLGGSNESYFPGAFTGSIDNVKFFNRILSAAEISALASGDQQCSISLSRGLQACYALSGNANDAINGLNGTVGTVTPAIDRNSVANECYSFGGTMPSIITLPNSPQLQGSSVSISLWAYPVSVSSGGYILFTKNTWTSYHEAYAISVGSSNFNAAKCNPTAISYAPSLGAPSINTWYHLVICVDGASLTFYINGVLQSSVLAPGAITYDGTGKPVCLGGSNESYFPLPFTGSIDNVRFYDRLLNSDEVQLLYTTDPRCSDPPYAVLKKTYDQGYYQMSGNTLYFKYDGEYNAGALNYSIYDDNRNQVVTTGCTPSSLNKQPGDNRYSLDLSACASSSGYYLLEVLNEKNERFVLKFKK